MDLDLGLGLVLGFGLGLGLGLGMACLRDHGGEVDPVELAVVSGHGARDGHLPHEEELAWQVWCVQAWRVVVLLSRAMARVRARARVRVTSQG